MSGHAGEVPVELQRPELALTWLDPRLRAPLVIATGQATPLAALDAELQRGLSRALPRLGAILLRGFDPGGPDGFREFVASFGDPLLRYEFGSTPRREITTGVYSASEYPAARSISLHNEQSYTQRWPARVWFYCLQPATTGGATLVADGRRVLAAIPESIRHAFACREVLYARNYGSALDLRWQDVFGTDDRAEVARFCAERGIHCEFDADGQLHTRERCPAVIRHPLTTEPVWFNQAHLFHVSSLASKARTSLEAMGERHLPRQAYFGDGGAIDEGWLHAVREVYQELAVPVRWQRGDVLILDNVTVAHGREPFSGERVVHVALT